MAVETPTPVRHTPPAAHAAKTALGNHGRAAAASDAGAAATGFSAMLGAAEDASADTAAGAGTPGAASGHGRKLGKGAPGAAADGSDAATLAAWNGMMQPAATALPGTGGAGGGTATSALAPNAVTGVGTGGRSLKGSVHTAGQALGHDAPGMPGAAGGKPLPKLTPPSAHPAPAGLADKGPGVAGQGAHAQTALAAAEAGAVGAGAASGALPGVPGAVPGAGAQPPTPVMAPGLTADPAASQQAAAGAMGAPTQMRFSAGQGQAGVGRVQAGVGAAAADRASLQAGSQQASALAGTNVVMGEGDGTSMRGTGPSTLSMGEGGQGRWAGMLSEIARAPQPETGAGGFAEGGSQGRRHSGADAQSGGGDGLGSGTYGFNPTGALGDGGFQTASSGVGASNDPQAAGGAGMMTPDEWLQATTPSLNAQGVQTAEITMDAFGAPVDVRIALSGSDAQVAFQSDQASTREMLGSAVPELQNLLQREGLVLSNVSVQGSGMQAGGGNAMGDGGGRGDRGESRRQARAEISAIDSASPMSARPRPTAAGNGALDLYV